MTLPHLLATVTCLHCGDSPRDSHRSLLSRAFRPDDDVGPFYDVVSFCCISVGTRATARHLVRAGDTWAVPVASLLLTFLTARRQPLVNGTLPTTHRTTGTDRLGWATRTTFSRRTLFRGRSLTSGHFGAHSASRARCDALSVFTSRRTMG